MGAATEQAEVVKVWMEPKPSPAEFVAYARAKYVVAQVRVETAPVKAPVLNGWPAESVVVAMTVARVALVPYAKPRTVGPAPPVAVMLPFKVAVVWAREEADWVVTIDADGGVVSVVLEV